MKLRPFFLSSLLSLLGLFLPAELGADDVQLRTIDAALTTTTACAGVGSPIIFSTTNPTFNALGFRNLGQLAHTISITGSVGITQLQAEIDGVDAQGNIYRISDQLRLPTFFGKATLSGYGRFANFQISVACSPNTSTFALSYEGSSIAPPAPVGSYQIGQLDKNIFNNNSAGTTTADTIQTPFGNSAGVLIVTNSATFPAGSTISVQCQGAPLTTSVQDVFALGVGSAFTFPVPSGSCPFVTVTYSAGGASANTFTTEYDFAPSGSLAGTYTYGPASLGVNTLTEPAAGTSALSNIIDTRGAKNAQLKYNCTAGTITINVQTYAEDGATALSLVSPVSGVAAATNADLYIDSESNPSVNTGTLATPPAGVVRFPQRAIAFSFTNAGAAGTCSARLFLTY